ncbi:MAG: methyltransferase [Candidatus Vogelbacteria bacterium]|nr:methyltransferase [Candidatus Vogelbacteria bacterium]
MPHRTERNMRIRQTRRISEPPAPEGLTEKEKKRSAFYRRLAFIKSREIFRDSAIVIIRKMKEKGQGRITNDTLETTVTKTKNKVEQKMEELRYMTDIINNEFPTLPPQVDRVIDMAGGAGDLGLAVSMEMMLRGQKLKETNIVDPVAELSNFNRLIIDELPDADKFREIVKYKVKSLQEAEIQADAMVVAKHACGDLTDTIIEKWVQSDSPVLVLMTCCQDKAQDQPARYKISQEDWKKWCKDSAKTNTNDPIKLAQGMAAMTRLDQARVDYLKRFGFEAKLIQTDKFPKGDVIIARRINWSQK